jgi:hypothetical protein
MMVLSSENVMDFYESLGFEETEIEDKLTALCFEEDAADNYALLTSEDGSIPLSLKQTVVFACYTAQGAYEWSTSFKNSYVFKDIWEGSQAASAKFAAVREYGK